MLRSRLRGPWARRAGFAAALMVANLVTHATTLVEPSLILFAPSAGVGTLFLMGSWGTRRVWGDALVLFLTATASLVLQGSPPPVAASIGLIAVGTGALASTVLARLRPAGLQLRTPLDLAVLAGSATAGALPLAVLSTLGRAGRHGDVFDVAADPSLLLQWGVPALLSTQLGTCLTVVGWLRLRDALRGTVVEAAPAGSLERAVLWTTGVLGSVVALGGVVPTVVPIAWASVPLAVWAGLRLRTSEAALHACAVVAIGVTGLLGGRGPFADVPPATGAIGLLSYLLVATGLTMLLALGRDERAALASRVAAQAHLLDAIHAATSDAVAVFSADGSVLMHNRAAEALVGSSVEATGRRLSVRAADGATLDPADYPVSRALRGEHVEDFDLQATHPGGTVRVLSASAHPLPHTAGAAWSGGAVLSYRDVTARLEAERRLADSEELFRLAFDESPLGLGVVSLDPADLGRIVRTNAAMARICGQPEQELLGTSTTSLMPAGDAEEHRGLLRALGDGQDDGRARAVRLLRPDGAVRWAGISTATLRAGGDGSGTPSALVLLEDITARREAEEALHHLASHDALTGLPNRSLLAEHLDAALAQGALAGGEQSDDDRFALLYLDLDGFKAVNDEHGHVAGDHLLREVGQRLGRCVRSDDTVARLGGDEFAVLCHGLHDEHVAELVERLRQAVSRPVTLAGGAQVRVGVSIGVASWDGTSTAEQLIDRADHEMYSAKRLRRSATAAPGAEGHSLLTGLAQPVHQVL